MSPLSSEMKKEFSVGTSPSLILTLCLCSLPIPANEQIEVTYPWFFNSIALMDSLHL